MKNEGQVSACLSCFRYQKNRTIICYNGKNFRIDPSKRGIVAFTVDSDAIIVLSSNGA